MTQGKTASSVNELISCLRQWRDSTPDAWILHTADVLERFQKELTASMTHARTLNSLLGKVEAENTKLRRVVEAARDLVPYATAAIGPPRDAWPHDSVILIFERALEAANVLDATDDKG